MDGRTKQATGVTGTTFRAVKHHYIQLTAMNASAGASQTVANL